MASKTTFELVLKHWVSDLTVLIRILCFTAAYNKLRLVKAKEKMYSKGVGIFNEINTYWTEVQGLRHQRLEPDGALISLSISFSFLVAKHFFPKR